MHGACALLDGARPTSYHAYQTRVHTKMSAEEVDAELVLPGLVGKEEEKQPGKDKADKVTGQRLKQINLGDDSDEDLDAEDEEDVSDL